MFFVCAHHPAWGPRKASFANTSLGASFQVGHVSAFPLISFRCGARTAYLEGEQLPVRQEGMTIVTRYLSRWMVG